jgi:hypothetical protein
VKKAEGIFSFLLDNHKFYIYGMYMEREDGYKARHFFIELKKGYFGVVFHPRHKNIDKSKKNIRTMRVGGRDRHGRKENQ